MNREQRNFISRLRRLEHSATPAPWSQYGDNIEDAEKIPLITMTKEHFHDKNAEFITEIRNAVPRLLHLIEQQEQEINRLKGSGGKPSGGNAPRSSTLMQ